LLATGAVGSAALLSATALFADSGLARGIDVVVADALMLYVPSLLAMGPQRPGHERVRR
jgi:hypothetical protein